MNKRILWIDGVRALSIVGVYITHSGFANYKYFNVINYVMIALFYFISGYLCKTDSKSLQIGFKRIIRRLLIPYIGLSVIYLLISSYFWKNIVSGKTEFLFHEFLDIILGHNFWFISCLISIELIGLFIFYIYKKLNCYKNLFITLVIISSIIFSMTIGECRDSIWHLDIALCSICYYLLGFLYYKQEDKFQKYEKNTQLCISSFLIYITIALFVSSQGAIVDAHINRYKPILIMIPLIIFGIFSIISIFKRINLSSELISIIGGNTLILYVFNDNMLNYTKRLFHILGIDSLTNYSTDLYCLLLCTIAIIGGVFAAGIFNKYFPILVGKKYNRYYGTKRI